MKWVEEVVVAGPVEYPVFPQAVMEELGLYKNAVLVDVVVVFLELEDDQEEELVEKCVDFDSSWNSVGQLSRNVVLRWLHAHEVGVEEAESSKTDLSSTFHLEEPKQVDLAASKQKRQGHMEGGLLVQHEVE